MSSDLTPEAIRHVAHLSRLYIADEEIPRYARELTSILGYIEQLNAVDTQHIQPTAHPLPLTNVLRADVPRPSVSSDEALRNAPDSDGTLFRVPKVLDQDGGA